MQNLLTKHFFCALFILFLSFSSASSAGALSWQTMTDKFQHALVHKGNLRSYPEQRIEEFITQYFDAGNSQLLLVETEGSRVDSVLDFIVFRCHGVLKKYSAGRGGSLFAERSVDHLMYHLLRLLDKLSYDQLCVVIDGAIRGKYNVFATLQERGLFEARDRLIYFLIEKATDSFEQQSYIRTRSTLSLRELIKGAVGGGAIRQALESNKLFFARPVVGHWEQIPFITNFFEKALKRKQCADFLEGALIIIDSL